MSSRLPSCSGETLAVGRQGTATRFSLSTLIIRLIIQTIPRYPSGAIWTDDPSNVRKLDPSGADWSDAEHPSRNWKVVGSNPTSGSKTAGQGNGVGPCWFALLASLIIPCG